MSTEREKALAAKEREAAEIERSRAAEAEALGRSKRLHEEAAAMHERAARRLVEGDEVEGDEEGDGDEADG